jgi:hypothetical protein
MHTVSRIIGGLSVGLTVGLAAAPWAAAQSSTQPPPPTINAKPGSGTPGAPFTMSWTGANCDNVSFTFGGKAFAASHASSGSMNVNVPADAAPGTKPLIVSVCVGQPVARTTFTVTAPPVSDPPSSPPSSPPSNPPVSNPPVTNPPVTNPPVRRPPVTTTTPPTTSTPPTTTTGPPGPSTGDTPPSTPSDGDLVLDKPAISPGDPLSAAGRGCAPGAAVTLVSDGERVGSAIAETDGTFHAPVEFTRIQAGRHQVTASCGVVLTGAVDQIVTSSTGGHSSTMIVLVFFVLAGVAVLRFS